MTDSYVDMRAKAGCPLTTPDELSTLANSEFTLIRCKVAMNYSTSCDVLRKLAEDKTWIIRLAVVCNKHTPIDVISKLSDDEDERVCERAINELARRGK